MQTNNKNRTKFILAGAQYSDVSIICEYLKLHPDIILIDDTSETSQFCNKLNSKTALDDFVDDMYENKGNMYTACGFTVQLNLLEKHPEIINYLKKNNIIVILVERMNILKTLVHRKLSKDSHTIKSDKYLTVNLSLDSIKSELEKVSESHNRLQSITRDLQYTTIYFEDVISSPAAELRYIQNILKVRQDSRLAKIKTGTVDYDLKVTVDNYEELFQLLNNHATYFELLQPIEKLLSPYSIINKKYESIFIHIPKSAGSSIEKSIYRTKGKIGHKRAIDYKQADEIKFKSYFSYAFTRHPCDKLISSYTYLMNGGRNKFDRQWASENLMQYSSFDEFVISLTDPSVRQKIFNWMHFIPQYQFICDFNNNIIIDYVGKYESIEDDFDFITKKMGIKTILPHENPGKHDSYESYYTKSTLEIVKNIYKLDFDLFGYDI